MSTENVQNEQEQEKDVTQFRELSLAERQEILQEIENLNKELIEYEYTVDYDSESLSSLEDFFFNKVNWKGRQSQGVVELNEIIDKITKQFEGKVRMNNSQLEAVYFFLTNYESSGYASARIHNSILKPIHEAYEKAVDRKNRYNAYIVQLQGKEQGLVDPDKDLSKIIEE